MNTNILLAGMGIILVIATAVFLDKGDARPYNCYGVYTYFDEPEDILEELTYKDALVAQYSTRGTDREVRYAISTGKHNYWNNRGYLRKLADLAACDIDFSIRLDAKHNKRLYVEGKGWQ